jgi:glycosyltransferase involved in cell wall biosynthesis
VAARTPLRLARSRRASSARGDSVVFVHSSDEMYGADRMLLEIVDALPDEARSRAEVWLPTDLPHSANPLCRTLELRGVRTRHLPLPVLRRSNRSPLGLAQLAVGAARAARAFRQAGPSLVYCTTSATFVMSAAARAARVPRVVGQVQEIWSTSDRRILGPLAAANHSLIAISRAVTDSLSPGLRERTTVVPNATPEPARWEPVGRVDIPLSYLVASRWNGSKGHATLLAAWALISHPGKLVVLGGFPLSGASVDVRELVSHLDLGSTVEVVGEVADCEPFFQAADVVVVPSDAPEGFGLVAIEAFACGRPVIGAAAGGLVEVIDHGVNGWLFEPGDVSGLTHILGSLTRPKVIAAGIQARQTYEERYTVQRFRVDWQNAMGQFPWG